MENMRSVFIIVVEAECLLCQSVSQSVAISSSRFNRCAPVAPDLIL